MKKKKNQRIRKELFMRQMTQGELAEILGVTSPELSTVLGYELAKAEQDRIIEKIRTADEEPA